MLLHESRRSARAHHRGTWSCWMSRIARCGTARGWQRGRRWLSRRSPHDGSGPTPCKRPSQRSTPKQPARRDTDWAQIIGLYDLLLKSERSPVVELNRAAAVAMRDGPAAGLDLIDDILNRGELRRLSSQRIRHEPISAGGWEGIRKPASSYRRALELARLDPERRFLERRLSELSH